MVKPDQEPAQSLKSDIHIASDARTTSDVYLDTTVLEDHALEMAQ